MDHLDVDALPSCRRQDRRHDRPCLRGAPAGAVDHTDRRRDAAAVARRRCRAGARPDARLRHARRRILGAAEHGRAARQRLPAGRLRVVDQIHGPHRGLDAGRLHGHHRLRRHSRGPARRSPAQRWSSLPSKAGWARSTKCGPGNNRFPIPSCWYCPAIPITSPQRMPTAQPRRRSHSSRDMADTRRAGARPQKLLRPRLRCFAIPRRRRVPSRASTRPWPPPVRAGHRTWQAGAADLDARRCPPTPVPSASPPSHAPRCRR